MEINNIVQSANAFSKTDGSKASSGADNSSSNGISFFDTLKEKLDEVNNQQLEADAVTQAFVKGDNVDVHQVMIAGEEAKQSLELAVQVRNKLVEAFQEISRMQL